MKETAVEIFNNGGSERFGMIKKSDKRIVRLVFRISGLQNFFRKAAL
jgi:hypothetical protein